MACRSVGKLHGKVKILTPTPSLQPITTPFPHPTLPAYQSPRAHSQQLNATIKRATSTMPLPRRNPSRALFTSLTKSSSPTIRIAGVRHESTQPPPTPDEGRSFKGQLYESTSTRLQKERVERARFAKERNESAAGRNWSVTFGIYFLSFYLILSVVRGREMLM